jgi:hypothetical protein
VTNYAPDGGGDYAYRYPFSLQADTGSLAPQNLTQKVNPPPDRRGKIGASDGSYWQCANWLWRVLSGLIDYFPVFILAELALRLGEWLNEAFLTTWWDEVMVFTVVILIVGFNNVFLQGMTGQSIGKKALGMQVVRGVITADGREMIVRPGLLITLVRQLCHIVDAAVLYLGFLAPLWTHRYQTFSDMMSNTAVMREPDGPVGLPFAPPGSKYGRI